MSLEEQYGRLGPRTDGAAASMLPTRSRRQSAGGHPADAGPAGRAGRRAETPQGRGPPPRAPSRRPAADRRPRAEDEQRAYPFAAAGRLAGTGPFPRPSAGAERGFHRRGRRGQGPGAGAGRLHHGGGQSLPPPLCAGHGRQRPDPQPDAAVRPPRAPGRHYTLDCVVRELAGRGILRSAAIETMDLSLYPGPAQGKAVLAGPLRRAALRRRGAGLRPL